jgi:voltage-gated potassium channel
LKDGLLPDSMPMRILVPGNPLTPAGLATTTDRSEQTRLAFRCIAALFGVTAFGTVGFLIIEPEWGFWDSLYFTLITVTTVGYGDEGLSSAGKVFAAVLLLGGIGTATYSLSVLIQIAIGYQLVWKKKMQQQIDQLRDHIVVCGFGRMGRTVCERLFEEEVPFVVIERDDEGYDAALEHGYAAIHGNATEDEILRRAGVERSRGVVCVLNADAENVFITLNARYLNADAFIACRAETDGVVEKVRRAGASLVVSPHYSAGVNIANAILSPPADSLPPRRGSTDAGIGLDEVTIMEGSPLVGQTICQYGELDPSTVFVAIRRPGGATIVRPECQETFEAGDRVIVAGTPADLSRISQQASPAEHALATACP